MRDRASPSAAIAVFTLFFLSCSGSPHIVYQIRVVPLGDSQKSEDGRERKIIEFDKKRMVRISERGRGLQTEFIFLRKETLKDVADRIQADKNGLHRVPELFPIRVHCYNYGTNRHRWDLYAFRLHNKDTGDTLEPVRMERYMKEYYGKAASALPYYWAFEQKENFQFLHKIPEWFTTLMKPATGSPAEEKHKTITAIRELEKTHPSRTELPPGTEIKGYILFPEPSSGSYVLEYLDKGPESIAFTPVHFDIRPVYDADDDPSFSPPDEDKRAAKLFESEIRAVERDLTDFVTMHRQLRLHDDIVTGEDKRK